ncbi:MAG: hypothetical protein JWR52_2363 [Marmoricola sp.]|nr:hypothetical protein [Marmoricola sp.]
MLPGLLSAFGAALVYGAGTVLQAVGVRRAADAVGETWWPRLWAGRLYVLGLALDALGFFASIAALRTLPLFVVESAIASSVAVTAVLAVVFLGDRLGRREVVALIAVAAGLVALALSAREGGGVPLSGPAPWLLLGAAAAVLVLSVLAARGGGANGNLLAVCAGLGFAGVGVAARVVVVPHAVWRLVLDPVPWGLLVFALTSMVAYGMALQHSPVTTVAAITVTVETIVPATIGLVWLGDRVLPGAEPFAALGFVLTLGGCVLVARHSADGAEVR